jgi:hypothetical protein
MPKFGDRTGFRLAPKRRLEGLDDSDWRNTEALVVRE